MLSTGWVAADGLGFSRPSACFAANGPLDGHQLLMKFGSEPSSFSLPSLELIFRHFSSIFCGVFACKVTDTLSHACEDSWMIPQEDKKHWLGSSDYICN